MSFVESVKEYFIRWNDFKTRSSRSEYWWATLFVAFASYFVGFAAGFLISFTFSYVGFSADVTTIIVGIAVLVMQIFIYIASTALVVRRLHDVDKSGWWYLIILTIVGIIPLFVWFCTKGSDGINRFGQDPLKQT